MIRISNLNSYYGRSHILHEVSLEVSTGTIVTVIGRNGVGKTTLLKTIMGLTDRATGSIMLDGRELIGAPTFERARAGIAYVPQGREIIPDFTVEENLKFGAIARHDDFIGDTLPSQFAHGEEFIVQIVLDQ